MAAAELAGYPDNDRSIFDLPPLSPDGITVHQHSQGTLRGFGTKSQDLKPEQAIVVAWNNDYTDGLERWELQQEGESVLLRVYAKVRGVGVFEDGEVKKEYLCTEESNAAGELRWAMRLYDRKSDTFAKPVYPFNNCLLTPIMDLYTSTT